jgi:two-component system chemotaxis response regulator CheB
VYGGGHSGVIPGLLEPLEPSPPSVFDLVVIAASYGGIQACDVVLSRLPSDFPAAIILAQHLPARAVGPFRYSLERRCPLAVTIAGGGTPLTGGAVYLAPATEQVLVAPDRTVALRPVTPSGRCLADPLFESAAAVFGARAIAVVLTGRLHDGSQGVRAVKAGGGRVLVQDPSTAVAPDMPTAALATGCCDFALPPDKIADALTTLVMAPGAADVFRVPLPPWAARPALS